MIAINKELRELHAQENTTLDRIRWYRHEMTDVAARQEPEIKDLSI